MPKITLSGDKLAQAMHHARERGMTFEEYVQEYVALAQEDMRKQEKQEKQEK
jgi:hypothetical protein